MLAGVNGGNLCRATFPAMSRGHLRFEPKANNIGYKVIQAVLYKYPGGGHDLTNRAINTIWGCFRRTDPLCDRLSVHAPRKPTERLVYTTSHFKRLVKERYCRVYPRVWKARLAADIYLEWARKQEDFGHRKDIDLLTIWDEIERWVYWGKGEDPWASK